MIIQTLQVDPINKNESFFTETLGTTLGEELQETYNKIRSYKGKSNSIHQRSHQKGIGESRPKNYESQPQR